MIKYSKKVQHSVHIFEQNISGTCVYRKLGKAVWFQIWISDYDLFSLFDGKFPASALFGTAAAGFENCIISSTTAIFRLMEGVKCD